MIYASLIAFLVALFLIIDRKEICFMNGGSMQIKTWLIVIVGNYLLDFMFLLAQYHSIRKTRKENLLIVFVRFLLSCFLVSWLIYGNVLYFRTPICQTEAYYLWLVMFLVLLLGYFEMLKCCCIGTCVCVMLPIFFFAVRRA